MFKPSDFNDSIHWLSLRFIKQELEEQYIEYRERRLTTFDRSKVIIIIITLALNCFFSYTAVTFFNAGNMEGVKAVFTSLGITNAAWICEFTFHKIRFLRLFGGFPYIIIILSSLYMVPLQSLATLAFFPGYLNFQKLIEQSPFFSL